MFGNNCSRLYRCVTTGCLILGVADGADFVFFVVWTIHKFLATFSLPCSTT